MTRFVPYLADKIEAGTAALRSDAADTLGVVAGTAEAAMTSVAPAAASRSFRRALRAVTPSTWALIALGIVGAWLFVIQIPELRRYVKMEMM